MSYQTRLHSVFLRLYAKAAEKIISQKRLAGKAGMAFWRGDLLQSPEGIAPTAVQSNHSWGCDLKGPFVASRKRLPILEKDACAPV